jgi:hypothetical protein
MPGSYERQQRLYRIYRVSSRRYLFTKETSGCNTTYFSFPGIFVNANSQKYSEITPYTVDIGQI